MRMYRVEIGVEMDTAESPSDGGCPVLVGCCPTSPVPLH